MTPAKRHVLGVALLWAVITAAGELLVVLWDIFPAKGSEEADLVDDAFRALTFMAVPVFAFVVASVAYAALAFRRRGTAIEDGPPIHSNSRIVRAWVGVTTALTVLLIIYPGAVGLTDLQGREQDEDLVVQVDGGQWFWQVTYPAQGARSFTELVLPVDQRVRFEVTSRDVLHSFWVPAFRVKIDAVPGLVTTAYATPDRLGSFEDATGFRLQCAELCGLGHGIMSVPVRVVEAQEFDAWVSRQIAAP